MSLAEMKKNVLQVLAENIHNNPIPGVVDTDWIARKLGVDTSEVINVLKPMNAMGMVISSVENHYSIITGEGLNYLRSMEYTSRRI